MQKKLFLKIEGDKWFLRNKKILKKRTYENDVLCSHIDKILKLKSKRKILCLEVGCADGSRLNLIRNKYKNISVVGVEPSKKAISYGRKNYNIKIYKGTADNLRIKKGTIDILIYGFCLYLCDEKDYEKISSNADKVLKRNGLVIIYDFFSKIPKIRKYKHNKKINSYKKDFRKIFINFKNYSNKIFDYENNSKNKDYLAISVLRKIN